MSKPPFVMSKYATIEDLLSDSATYYEAECETMRQRVKELEYDVAMRDSDLEYWETVRRELVADHEKELATLKQAQEPVAWMWFERGDEYNGYEGRVRFAQEQPSSTTAKSGMTPLYTSAAPKPGEPA